MAAGRFFSVKVGTFQKVLERWRPGQLGSVQRDTRRLGFA